MTTKINDRTPEEIKKKLGCYHSQCGRKSCSICEFHVDNYELEQICADALAYIQRLETDNARLQQAYDAMGKDVERFKRERDEAIYARPKWISVEERLPEPYTRILALVDFGRYGKGLHTMTHFEDGEWSVTMQDGETVTHWMPLPLPEPPKEG